MAKRRATHLTRFTNRVKQIRKAHPNMAYRTAQKQASREMKGGKRIGATTSRKKAAPRKKARKKAAGAPRIIKRTDVYETIGTIRSKACATLKDQYGKLAIRKLVARKKTDKRKLGKEMTKVAADIRKFSAGKKR